jgi:predicted nuclease of predicted toxin-antitoxin system
MKKFHLDEQVSNALAAALRQHGYDATTAPGADLLEAEDELHIEHALREGRIIVTHDRAILHSMRVAYRPRVSPIAINSIQSANS